jgi:hypothetical protein
MLILPPGRPHTEYQISGRQNKYERDTSAHEFYRSIGSTNYSTVKLHHTRIQPYTLPTAQRKLLKKETQKLI